MRKGSKHTPESIIKLQQSHQGPRPWMRGKKINYTIWNKGKKETRPEVIQKIRESNFKNPRKYWLGKKLSKEHINKLKTTHLGVKLSKETCQKMSESRKGIRHWAWKGGVTPENIKIRNSIEGKLWRDAVFARDNWTCQKTFIRGGSLIAHHIYNFSENPELRFAIDNGITLSKEAHKEFHKIYGRKNNCKTQIIEFLNKPL